MANQELKITYRIVAIIGTVIVLGVITGYIYLRSTTPHLFSFSGKFTELTVELHVDSIPAGIFHQGMTGCENLYPDKGSYDIYVTTIGGIVYKLSGISREELEIVEERKHGEMTLGIEKSPWGAWWVISVDGPLEFWEQHGGKVKYTDNILHEGREVAGPFAGVNGLAADPDGNLFVAFSNLDYFSPSGGIIKIVSDTQGRVLRADTVLRWPGLVNGLFFDARSRRLIFSSTLQGAFIHHEGKEPEPLYTKLRFLEAIDDLCIDSGGRIWMADPGNSSVKMIEPGSNQLVRFRITGLGQVSSCRTRMENGEEIIYMTELKQKQALRSLKFDGRGVFSCPVQSLLGRAAGKDHQ